ncbi:MAG: hypothetical protein AB1634_09310 [Thermodesulfobacteriota bacterium]
MIRKPLLTLTLSASLAAGCSTTLPVAWQNDVTVAEQREMQEWLAGKRQELAEVVAEYQLTCDPVFRQRLEVLIREVTAAAGESRQRFLRQRAYHAGLPGEKWQLAVGVLEEAEALACAMQFQAAELAAGRTSCPAEPAAASAAYQAMHRLCTAEQQAVWESWARAGQELTAQGGAILPGPR